MTDTIFLGALFVWKLTNTAEKLKLVQQKQAHNGYVLKCLLSPDTKLLATTSADKTVKIWDMGPELTCSKTLVGHTAWVWDCAFSADSAYLISGSSDKTAKLWDVQVRAPKHSIDLFLFDIS